MMDVKNGLLRGTVFAIEAAGMRQEDFARIIGEAPTLTIDLFDEMRTTPVERSSRYTTRQPPKRAGPPLPTSCSPTSTSSGTETGSLENRTHRQRGSHRLESLCAMSNRHTTGRRPADPRRSLRRSAQGVGGFAVFRPGSRIFRTRLVGRREAPPAYRPDRARGRWRCGDSAC